MKAPSIYHQVCLRFLSPLISHHGVLNWGTVWKSVSPLLHTALRQLNDSHVRFISPVAYIFELGTTGALSSNPFPCLAFAYMHNAWQNGIPERGVCRAHSNFSMHLASTLPVPIAQVQLGFVAAAVAKAVWAEDGCVKLSRRLRLFLTTQSGKRKIWTCFWASLSQNSSGGE